MAKLTIFLKYDNLDVIKIPQMSSRELYIIKKPYGEICKVFVTVIASYSNQTT